MKQLKHIFTIFFFSLSVLPIMSFAASKVSLEVNGKDFDINDPIQLQATIISDGAGDITIEGIANLSWFQVVGRNQSQSYQNINGKSSAKIQLTYSLKATKKGEYELWPLVLSEGTGKLLSNTVKIKVTWEQIFLGNVNTLQKNTTPPSTKPIVTSTKNQVQQERFEEIKDIKKNMSIPFLRYRLSFLVIIFAWVATYLYFYKSKKKEEIEKIEEQKKIIIPKKEINYQKMIKEVEKEYLEAKKETFYLKLWNVFRFYISQEIDTSFKTKTLKEAKDDLDKKHYEVLKRLYYPEYNIQKDTQKERKYLIKELLQLCK